MTKQGPCSCGGSNENCARCYGRGFIERGNNLASRPSKAKRKKGTITASSLLDLPRNPSAESVSPMHSRATTGRSMKSCPLCKNQVREDRLQRHVTSRCPARPGHTPRLSSRRKTTISLRDIQLFVKCPACGVDVPSDQFTKHRALAHGRVGQSRRTEQTPVASPLRRPHAQSVGEGGKMKRKPAAKEGRSREDFQTESRREKGELEVERPSWWDNLDSTKNHGYPAREEGRYGSYPSHDGFDDESKP